jgi:NADPH:quinone reductase
VTVAYAGVNFAEVMARRGDWHLPLPYTPGLEIAGRVTVIGDGVDPDLLGAPVAAFTGRGGYAEVAVASADVLLPITPTDNVPLSVAVASACVLPTAWGVLLEAGRMRAGDTVLVHAAAGGVGSIIGQLARHFDAKGVVGVVSTAAKADYAASFSCWDELILADDFPAGAEKLTSARGFDVICDSVGGSTRAANMDLLAPLGRLVVFGNASAAADIDYGLLKLQQTNRTVAGYNIAALAEGAPLVYRKHALQALELMQHGIIRPDVTAVMPLSDARHAHELLERRATTGKILLQI